MFANNIRRKSDDPDTQIGAAILTASGVWITGTNTFTKGVEQTEDRIVRPLKYTYIEHAERNAIYSAAKYGYSLDGATLYLFGMGPPTAPCVECARAIVQSGIIRVVGQAFKPVSPQWVESLNLALGILKDGGVEFIDYE